MSTRPQRVSVPWIESGSCPNVAESSVWTAPPNARPNTSEPKELVPVDGGGGGGLVPGVVPGVVHLPLATRPTLPYLIWQVRAREARALAECAFRALRRHPVSAVRGFLALAFLLGFALALFLAGAAG